MIFQSKFENFNQKLTKLQKNNNRMYLKSISKEHLDIQKNYKMMKTFFLSFVLSQKRK